MIRHPAANCAVAWLLYMEWADHKKGSKDYAYAGDKYKWHLAKCPVCREALDANKNI